MNRLAQKEENEPGDLCMGMFVTVQGSITLVKMI